MTQHTDADRAEFEAWYIAGVRQRKAAFSTWSDVEIRDGCMAPSNEGYRVDSARTAWDAWQAARRAPAVPETIEQRAKKLKGLQVLTGATAGVPEAIALARSRFVEAYGRSPLHDDLAYACLLIDAYGGAPAAPVPQGYDSGVQTGNRVTLAFDTQSNATAWFEKFCDDYDAAAGTKTIKLSIPADAAPQPPEAAQLDDIGVVDMAQAIDSKEAASVQLPEYGIDTANHAGIRVRGYTEHQVRQLLAQHGIK